MLFQSVGTFQTDIEPSKELYIYECGFEDVKPREPYQYEQIDYYLIHYILAGEGLFFINEEVHHLKAGDGFVIPPHTDNNYYPLVGNPWSYRWIGFKGNHANTFLEKCGFSEGNYIYHYDNIEEMNQLFSNVYTHCQNNLLYAAIGDLYHVLSALIVQNEENRRCKTNEKEKLISEALDMIHNQYNKSSLTVSFIAATLKIERTYLFKLFKEYVTVSPQQYLIQYRLNKATELLRKTSYSVEDIAYLVGFNSLSHFSNSFSSHKKMSPQKYRSQFQKSTTIVKNKKAVTDSTTSD